MKRHSIDTLETRRLLSLAAGLPDPAFGAGGKASGSVVVQPGPAYDESRLRTTPIDHDNPPLVLPDGRVLAVLSQPENFNVDSGPPNGTLIARFFGDGRLDTSWGERGFARVRMQDDLDPTRVTLRSDALGRVYALAVHDYRSASLVRFTPRGTLDEGFASFGSIDGLFWLTTLAGVDSKSRVVLRTYDDAEQPVLQRYTGSGRLDPAFDGDGVIELPLPFNPLTSIVDRSDRVLLASANSPEPTSDVWNLVVRRWTDRGVPDASFGTGGMAVLDEAVRPSQDARLNMFARTDGTYSMFGTQVAAASVSGAAIWQLSVSGDVPTGRIEIASDFGFTSVMQQVGMAADGTFSVYNHGDSMPGNLPRFARVSATGQVLVERSLDYPADVTGQRRAFGAAGFRRDGSPIAVASLPETFVRNPWGQEPYARVTGLAAWRVGGGVDGGVKSLPRMRLNDVVTVRPDGQPVFGFADVAGNYAGRADRLADGSWRARQGTLAGTLAKEWSVGFGRVFANYGSLDFVDYDGIALNATVLEPSGTWKTFAGGDDGTKGTFDVQPRGFASSGYFSFNIGSNFTTLYAPSGREIQTAVEWSATGSFALLPQRTSDNVFITPLVNPDPEGTPLLPGIALQSPDGQLVSGWGNAGLISGNVVPWFADSRGRLLYFGPDRKTLNRLTRSGQPDAAYSAVPVDGWSLDIDSRDRLIAWRVVPTSGPSSGEVQVRRYTVDGAIDATFGRNGEARVRHWLGQGSNADVYLDSADNVMVVTIDRTSSPRVKWAATKLLGTATVARPAIAVGQPIGTARAGVWSEVEVSASVLA